jgi:hypothetical protein
MLRRRAHCGEGALVKREVPALRPAARAARAARTMRTARACNPSNVWRLLKNTDMYTGEARLAYLAAIP